MSATMEHSAADDSLAAIFGGRPMYIYTVQDGIDNGQFLPADGPEFAGVAAQHCNVPVFISPGIRALIDKACSSEQHCNDAAGVLHDILWMTRLPGAVKRSGHTREAQVIITGTGRRRVHRIRNTAQALNEAGDLCVTLYLPSEDRITIQNTPAGRRGRRNPNGHSVK